LDDSFQESAVRAAQIMGLRIAGVDILESDQGPLIMEVNTSPGLEGIESCSQLDVAGAIIDYMSAQVDFPEIDLRQRLTVSRGYGITEIHIPVGSSLVGKSLTDAGLHDGGVNVLTLYQGTTVIPNPRSDRIIEAGDRLLCFGRLESMREMIPNRSRKRRTPRIQPLDGSQPQNSRESAG
jgi:ribosomal protein S6--L-glutamate ligase